MSTTRKEREKERRQQEILDAAKRVFLSKGYLGTTMDQIAQEAEFSKGTLYSYFSSKYELFAMLSLRVIQDVLDGFAEITDNLIKEELNGQEYLQKLLVHWSAAATNHIEVFRLAMGWVASDERAELQSEGSLQHQKAVSAVISHFASAIVRGRQDNSLAGKGEAVSIACQIWSGMMGALLFDSRNEELTSDFPVPGQVQNETFMKDFIDLLIAGLSPR